MNKKYIIIGSGVLAFGIVMYVVINKFRKNAKLKLESQKRCPNGYNADNGRCKKIVSSNTNQYPNQYDDYTDYTDYYIAELDTQPNQLITKSGSRLRKEPNTTSDIIKTYEKGISLEIVDTSSESDGLWYKVQEKSSINSSDVKREGWMRSDVVTLK